MRAATVFIVAGLCGVAAFASTLITRAPRIPPQPSPDVRGRTIIASGVPPRSRKELEAVVRTPPDQRDEFYFWAVYQLALRVQWDGEEGEADGLWNRANGLALNVHPGDRAGAYAQLVRGEYARRNGDAEEEADSFRTAVRLFDGLMQQRPNGYRAPYYAGWCCRRLKDADGTGQYWSRVEELIGTDDARADPERLYALACERAMRGYQGQAIGALGQLAKSGWSDADLLSHAEEFESLRGDEEFQRIVESMRPVQRDKGVD